jgi:hypothetical protein
LSRFYLKKEGRRRRKGKKFRSLEVQRKLIALKNVGTKEFRVVFETLSPELSFETFLF